MKKKTKTPKNKGGQTQNRTVDTRIFNPSDHTGKLGDKAKKRKCGTIAGQGAEKKASLLESWVSDGDILKNARLIVRFVNQPPAEQRAIAAAAMMMVALGGGE